MFKHCVFVIKEMEVLFPIIINFIIAYCASVVAVKLNIEQIEVYVSQGRSFDAVNGLYQKMTRSTVYTKILLWKMDEVIEKLASKS